MGFNDRSYSTHFVIGIKIEPGSCVGKRKAEGSDASHSRGPTGQRL